MIYLLAFPSGEGGAGTATDEEKHLPADFDLSSKICKSILLLIHHYRGPPSLLGKALKEFDKLPPPRGRYLRYAKFEEKIVNAKTFTILFFIFNKG